MFIKRIKECPFIAKTSPWKPWLVLNNPWKVLEFCQVCLKVYQLCGYHKWPLTRGCRTFRFFSDRKKIHVCLTSSPVKSATKAKRVAGHKLHWLFLVIVFCIWIVRSSLVTLGRPDFIGHVLYKFFVIIFFRKSALRWDEYEWSQ